MSQIFKFIFLLIMYTLSLQIENVIADPDCEEEWRIEYSPTKLQQAVINNDFPLVTELVKTENINEQTCYGSGMTPLMFAAQRSIPMVQLLLKAGADMSIKSYRGLTLLHMAIMKRDSTLVNFLLENGGTSLINTPSNGDLYTPLLYSAFKGSEEITLTLINHGADLNSKDACNKTVLFHTRNPKLIKMFLEAGLNPSAVDCYQESVLREALFHVNLEAAQVKAKLLIQYGADLNSQDKYGMTALLWGAQLEEGRDRWGLAAANLLIENGADVNIRNHLGYSAILLYNTRDIGAIVIPKLIAAGAIPYHIKDNNFAWEINFSTDLMKKIVNYRNDAEQTHLILATLRKESLALIPLIKAGINPNEKDSNGKMALDYAIENGDDESIKILKQFI